jgi:purine-cytosine permease-like protein
MPLGHDLVKHAPPGAILWQFAEVALRGRDLRVLNTRIVALVVVAVAATTIAYLASGNFLTTFGNFLHFLGYLFAPWTAINLIDFYFVRRRTTRSGPSSSPTAASTSAGIGAVCSHTGSDSSA